MAKQHAWRRFNPRAARYYSRMAAAEHAANQDLAEPLDDATADPDEVEAAGWCPSCKRRLHRCGCDLEPTGYARP